ncbi:hypothetical protein HY450_02910 [Candidatus Pacearchaeota archaeon]|nr:hypothetical protein [Candidatus Pacearchaeota archaeon]
METKNLKETLIELRKSEKRKFEQSVDLIVNLRNIDIKRESVNVIADIPNKVKEKKVCAFLTKKSGVLPTITEPEFAKYKEKKELKNLIKDYDYFISAAPLMPKVAATFGKVLGPAGKMPSPQLGIINKEDEKTIKEMLEKISKSLKIRLKEASIKIPIGKENMKDEEIIENVKSVYKAVENALPKKKDNVRNVMLKFTMSKPVKTEVI